MKRHIALVGVVLVAAACSGYSVPPRATPSPIRTSGDTSTTSPATPSPIPATPGATGPSAEIEVTITGGPHDGFYRAVAKGACNSQPAQNKFSVAYANSAAADGFVALDLVLNDAATATDDESDNFVARISVGGANGGISYSIDPRSGEGDGGAFLDMSPSDATLDVEVDARDGATIEVFVTCGLP